MEREEGGTKRPYQANTGGDPGQRPGRTQPPPPTTRNARNAKNTQGSGTLLLDPSRSRHCSPASFTCPGAPLPSSQPWHTGPPTSQQASSPVPPIVGASKGSPEVLLAHSVAPWPLAPKSKALLLPLPRLLFLPNYSLQVYPSPHLASSRQPPLNMHAALLPLPLTPLRGPAQPALLHKPPREGSTLSPTFSRTQLELNPAPGESQPPRGSRCGGQSSTNVGGISKRKLRNRPPQVWPKRPLIFSALGCWLGI